MSDQPPSEGQGGDKPSEEAMREGPPESAAGGNIIPPSGEYMQGGASMSEPAPPSPTEPEPGATIRMSDMPSAPAPPPMGGYTPPPTPPEAASATPPPPQMYGAQGGYTPPPPAGGAPPPPGGYAPPPPGGYQPPPPGGYAPPPPGGYQPPPPGGGYGAPPPGGPVSMGAINQASIQSFFRRAFNIITKPRVDLYQAEVQNANWNNVIIAVGSVTIVAFIAGLINGAIARTYGGSIGAAFGYLIFVPLFFFAGAGVLWLSAKIFGGQGQDFMLHSYLLSLSYAPTRLVWYALIILGIGPLFFITLLLQFLLWLYQVYHAGLSMQVSQRMEPSRAQLAAWVPAGLALVLVGACCALFFATIAAYFSSYGITSP